MKSSFENIIFEEDALQSRVFGDQYKEYLQKSDISTFNGSIFNDISDLLNNILLKYDTLTDFQKDSLIKIFIAFNNIRTKIDPRRLKAFEYFLNNDEELLLYRKSDKGLINIIIHSEECIAFSLIGKNPTNRILKFYGEKEDDFEALSYYFFS